MDKECLELLKTKGMEIYFVPREERERWSKANEPVINIFTKRAGKLGQRLLDASEKAR
jgi:TRAP-type C4-dicarboxylate transport system substrate-binding protein